MKRTGFFCICLIIIASSCKNMFSESTLSTVAPATGKCSQLIVILDTNWDKNFTDSIFDFFQQPQAGLPQKEPMFDIFQLQPNLFSDDVAKRHNIVQFEINSGLDKPTCEIKANVWSQPQIYVRIAGKNMADCYSCLKINEVPIMVSLYENVLAKIQSEQASNPDTEMQEKIKDKFGILLTLPKGKFEVYREGKDYLWLGFNTAKNVRYILIYETNDLDMSRSALIRKRNNFCTYIESTIPDDCAHTAETETSPLYETKTLGMDKGAELRGCWETKIDFMGGPFYQFSFDNGNGKCVAVDGFIYAPKELQRDYLRQVEAIVKSVK